MRAFDHVLGVVRGPASRRDVLKAGGVTVTLGALVAACGNDRGGSDEAGRVGNAPTTTALPSYEVDDAVLLRTAASLELTAVEVYNTAIDAGLIPDENMAAVEAFIANHEAIADEMNTLVAEVGGEAWTCTNDWLMARLVTPVLTAITTERVVDVGGGEEFRNELSDEEKVADTLNFAEALENIAVASHQMLVGLTGHLPARTAHARAASLEARQAAELAIEIGGAPDAYVSPELLRTEADENTPLQFAVPTTFGSTSQIEIRAGAADQNGVRLAFTLQTPAENTFVYNELACQA